MFTGFKQSKYPEYEVITPQLQQSFSVRTLTVQDEEKMKGSLKTPLQIADHLNTCIFSAITKSPEEITDYNSFLKNVTMKDRDALLYGLYHITYGEIRNYTVNCGNSNCGASFDVTVNASDTFNFNPYQGEENIIQKRVTHNLPVFTNVSAVIKQPTLADEINIFKNLGSRPGATTNKLMNILPISSFKEDIEEQADPIEYTEFEDIIDAYSALPSRDKKSINDRYYDEFGQFGVEFKIRTTCPYCENEEIQEVNLAENFFSMVLTS